MNEKEKLVNLDNLEKHQYIQIIKEQKQTIENQDKKIKELLQQIEEQDQQLKELEIKEEKCISYEEKIEKYKKDIGSLFKRIPWQITDQSLIDLSQSMVNQLQGQSIYQQGEIQYMSAYQELEAGQNAQNQEIFEAFYIIGIENSQIKDNQQSNRQQYNSKIQYKQYKKHNSDVDFQKLTSIEEIIEKFACPNGNNVEQIFDEDIEDEIQRIICQSKVPFQNFYMFNIKGDDLQSENPKNIHILQQFNHSRQLFGYCLKIEDFLVESRNGKNPIFLSFNKILCFVTYFPIQALFKTLFEQILFIIKVTRQDSFRVKKRQKDFSEIDGVNIIKLIQKILNVFIQKSSQLSITKHEQKIEINFADELSDLNLNQELQKFFQSSKISYTVPKPENLYIETKKLEAHIVLKLFSFEQFFQILMEILREGKIIFCCQNQNLLTAITSFFHTSLLPFQWFHQIIFNIPIDSLALLEFNQPILFGVNMQYQQLKFQRNILLANKVHDITYVNINEKKPEINIIEKVQKQKLNWFDQQGALRKYFYNKEDSISFIPNYNQENNAKEFLKNLQDIIKLNLIKKVVPLKEEDFVIKQTNKLNDHFIFHRLKKNIQRAYQDQEDQNFIINYVISAVYFTEYLRHQYIKS